MGGPDATSRQTVQPHRRRGLSGQRARRRRVVRAWSYRDQLTGLRHTIYTRCQQRAAYDEASQQARAAQETYYRALLVDLSRHPSRQSAAFNTQLVRNVRHVIDGLQAALDNGAPKGCTAFH